MNKVLKGIENIIENKEELKLTKKEIEELNNSLKYIKLHAIQKIIEEGVVNKEGLVTKIKCELLRYNQRLDALKWRKKYIEDLKENVETENQPDMYKNNPKKLEEDIITVKKMISRLAVIEEKAREKDAKEIAQTLVVAYDISKEDLNKLVNTCSRSFIRNGKMQNIVVNGEKAALFEKKDNNEYTVNPEAIYELSNILEKYPEEIKKIEDILKVEEQIKAYQNEISRLKKERRNNEEAILECRNNGKEYEEYLKSISDEIEEIENLKKQINDSKLPTKKPNFFVRLFRKITRKEIKNPTEEMENKLKLKTNELKKKVEKQGSKFFRVRKVYYKNMPQNEKKDDKQQETFDIPKEDLAIIESKPWIKDEDTISLLKELTSKNKQLKEKIADVQNETSSTRNKKYNLEANLSPKARELYMQANKYGKDMFQSLYSSFLSEEKKDESELSPNIALKIMKIVCDTQKIHTKQDVKNAGIMITDEQMEFSKKQIDSVAEKVITDISEGIGRDLKHSESMR